MKGLLLGLTGTLSLVGVAHAECSDLMPSDESRPVAERALTSNDLARLRDIGPVDVDEESAPILSVSPGGDKIAFQLRRADPKTNSYCLGMVVIDGQPGALPRVVNLGGTFIRKTHASLGMAGLPSGNAAVITPKWSPNGQFIAFLRRDEARTGVWVARVDGGGSRAATHLAFDVQDFAWMEDGRHIVIVGQPGLPAAEVAIKREGARGYAFGDHVLPLQSPIPFPGSDIPRQTFVVDLITGGVRTATTTEAAILSQGSAIAGADLFRRDAKGDLAWTQRDAHAALSASAHLHMRLSDGESSECAVSACEHIIDLGWLADGRTIWFERHEGADLSMTGLYVWAPGAAPRQIALTNDIFLGCQDAGTHLVCAREGATRPRHLDLIDVKTGESRVLFDPNPEFRGFRLGKVERLRWTNRFGIPSFGDLVLPVGYKAGKAYPLIVVGYESRGFLRGGTGDEYPIQVFANQGFAVLSFERPLDYGYVKGAKTPLEVELLNRKDWTDRRSVLSSLERGVDLIIKRGIADPNRIGLTGFSDGAAGAQFAMINSHMFSAVALSTCCEDVTNVRTLLGPAFAAMYSSVGYPLLTQPKPAFWRDYSIVENAARIKTPLLLQLADTEYLYALEAYTALKEQGDPVDLYVFPDEYHVKWQPAHRLAVYDRNLSWFRAKLQPVSNASP